MIKSMFLLIFLALPVTFIASEVVFLDETTAEATGIGKAQKESSPLRTSANCLAAARMTATTELIAGLVEKSWPNVKGQVKREEFEGAMRMSVQGVLKGGRATKTAFDDSTDPVTCQVKLRIERIDLPACQEAALAALAASQQEESPKPKKKKRR